MTDMTTRCRETETAILRAMANVGQSEIANRMGVDKSNISRMKDSEIQKIAAFIVALDQQLVHKDAEMTDPAELSAMRVLIAASMSRGGR